MECKVIDNLLYVGDQQVPYKETPNVGVEITPTLIVIHYTGDNSLEGALSWLTTKRSKVSAHIVVDKDGTIYQLAPFNVATWHAGKSSYGGSSGVNSFSIGIENVGIGDEWPDEQIEANRAVVNALFEAYPIEDVVGHEDVASGRKGDPGPNYPWDKVVSY
jgi:N-acetylmuramoyl-L-alanine amidase